MTTKQVSELLAQGYTLATAESCTGGGIGAAITAVPGASRLYKGGIISYCDSIKHSLLQVPQALLTDFGAVSGPVAIAMAKGARQALEADKAVSTTGLLGPGGDDRGNPVGTVFIGCARGDTAFAREYHLTGTREEIRRQVIQLALEILSEN